MAGVKATAKVKSWEAIKLEAQRTKAKANGGRDTAKISTESRDGVISFGSRLFFGKIIT